MNIKIEKHKHHIVILDDNYHILRSYIAELECLGIEVSVTSNISDFNKLLSKNKKIDLFIIDVMLPSDGFFSTIATDHGTITGLLVGKEIRYAGIETPIIFFSVAWLKNHIEDIKDTKNNLRNSIYLRKHEILPHELGEIILAILEKGKMTSKLGKSYQKIIDSLTLNPNFCGFGIDLKKLFK
ncbi:MAG: hypothetical protein Q8M57_01895 [Nitrosomonas sp.]|uniref:hypothetical protein n=1 Tax=Nitrosomonas sp. TaxID=42353 RepID=UPI002734AD8A|nr:hypothetical protein [Nitrosomonas sp.]MDP3279803.1 hypothetical protein [Nitrosomonas sp.]